MEQGKGKLSRNTCIGEIIFPYTGAFFLDYI